MALRVLLADESTTIKKVILLALQDFGVEVKSVPVGLDVLSVAKSFRPDIVFADVLLSKKSGYDVSQELKSNPEMKNIPVILMWSGFMELDEARAKSSMANDRLEKPFDADLLRGLVRKHVPRTQSNSISSFLSFPAMPEFQEIQSGQNLPGPTEISIEGLPELEEEEFSQVPLHQQKVEIPAAEEHWTQQQIQPISPIKEKVEFQAPVQAKAPTSGDPSIDKFMIGGNDLGELQVESDGEFEEVTFAKTLPPKELISQAQSAVAESVNQSLSQKPLSATETVLLERVAREEARAIIESICWKIMPEMTERIVREEISRLMKQAEKEV